MCEDANDDSYFFSYDALKLLINDEEEIMRNLQNTSFEEVVLVPFKINMSSRDPFNTIMLARDASNNELCFTTILNNIQEDSENRFADFSVLFTFIKCYLFSLLHLKDYHNYDNNIDFKGIYLHEKKIYMFIDLTQVEINVNLMYKTNQCWFVLMDEVINRNHICNIPISYDVTNFFVNNSEFIFLKNGVTGEDIEIPSVVYTGTHEKLLYFTFVFGNIKSNSNSILGSNYYFTNFKNAIRQGGWSKDYKPEFRHEIEITENNSGKYIKGGIIRYALFLGNYLIKENLADDEIDSSEIKKARLINDELDYIYEKLTLRISDHDSLWNEKYDSVILGNIELDNGEILKETPMFVTKSFEDQTPLSYHYINKSLLKENFNELENYEIL
jgi:hypothetical protein